MTQRVILILILSILGAGAAVGTTLWLTPAPCEEPIHYRIGTIDPRFEVSPKQFAADVAEAAMIWERALSKPLFIYDPKSALTVNLVYDRRQQLTQQEAELSADIAEKSQTAEEIKLRYRSLRADYMRAEAEYQALLSHFTKAQDTYNAEVTTWNSAGGAPKKRYDALNAEKARLATERAMLDAKRESVNALADTVNAFIHKYNLLVSTINTTVDAFNHDGLAGTQFEEGVYMRDNEGELINIYQFSNKIDLVRVLAHELGHARGLEHNNNPESIMSPINQSEKLEASLDDLRDLRVICNIK